MDETDSLVPFLPTEAVELHPRSGSRVAVLYRDRTVRDALCKRLAVAGYDVVVARHDAEVSDPSAGARCHALVCGVGRTVAPALLALERLRERQSDACVIMVGPDPGADHVAILLRAGAYDYVTLPLKPGRLEDAVRQGLATRLSFIQVRELSGQLRATNDALAKERDNLRHWNRNLVLLNQLAQCMAESLNADDIVRILHSRLTQMVPFDRIGVAWLKPERVWAHSPHTDHEQEREAARQAVMAEIARLPFVGRKTDDVHVDDDLVPEPPSLDLHPTLTVPMMVGAGQVGLMRLERRDGPAFTDHEAELMKVVAGSLALALRNAEAHSHVQTLAMTDGLTGLLNRRAFMYYLGRELKETERFGTPLALLMMDLDHFKTVNDRHGHLAGDRLLNEVAGLLTGAVRAMDVVTRYGGEEFALILRRTALPQAAVLAERIRAKIEGHTFVANDIHIPLTMSMGIVTLPNPQLMNVEDLIAAADKTLYQAKARGRNRVEVYETA